MTDILFSSWGGVVTDNRGKPEAERQAVPTLNLPLEFDKERKIRAFVGWDGIVIRDPEVNIVDFIRAYLEAVQKESCGKCTPCRVGTRVMATIMNRIADGQGKVEDLKQLKYLGEIDPEELQMQPRADGSEACASMPSIILETKFSGGDPIRRRKSPARNIRSR